MVNSFNRGDSFTIRTCDKINQVRQRLGGNLCVLGNPRVYTQKKRQMLQKAWHIYARRACRAVACVGACMCVCVGVD